MSHQLNFLRAAGLMAAASLLLSACGGGANIAEPTPLTDIEAPAYRMETLWRTDGGDGAGEFVSGFRPAVAQDRVFVANRDGYVTAIDVTSGRKIWRSRTGERLISGPTAENGTLLMGTRDGQVVALSADSGERQWTAELSSEVIAAPAAANGMVVARALDGRIVALDLATGDRRWTIEHTVPTLTMRGTSPAQIVGNTVYAGLENGKVVALDSATGETRWEQSIAVPSGRSELERIVDIDAAPLIVGNELYAASAGNVMASLSLTGGRVRWKQAISAATGLASNDSDVFTTDVDGVAWAVNRLTGNETWEQDALKYREPSAPVLYESDVLVGDYDGYLHWLSADDGSVIARGHPLGEAIRSRPVVVEDRVIVLGADGDVAAVRFRAAGG